MTISAYITGVLHAELMMIRNDLHMGDVKSALAKVNDTIKIMDEKVAEAFYGSEKNVSE
jgi:hypothetical protein